MRKFRLHPSTGSWFETAFGLLTMRWSDFKGLDLMVSLSNHELVAVRRPHREAMGIVFQQPASGCSW
jgi:hypothetical protein